MHCSVQCHCVAAHVDLQRPQTKTSHMFEIFIRHMWMPQIFVAQTHTHIMDGGIMWYTAQKLFWTCTFNFILINHSTHCAFCCSSWQMSWWFTHSHIQMQCSQKQSALPSSRYSVKLWGFLSQMAQKQRVNVFFY